jgi:hypothetical protein
MVLLCGTRRWRLEDADEPSWIARHHYARRNGGRHNRTSRNHRLRADVGHDDGAFANPGVRADFDLVEARVIGRRPRAV